MDLVPLADAGARFAESFRILQESFPAVALAIVALVGACVGSFLNVVIWRLPTGQSILKPNSRCPSCLVELRWRENLPIVGWFLTGRACSRCGGPVSARYPLIEAITAALAAVLVFREGLGWATLVRFAFVAALVAITFIDLDHFIIPNVISYGGIVLGFLFTERLHPLPDAHLGVAPWLERVTLFVLERRDALAGILLGGGSLYLVALAYWWVRRQEGLGGGDVKMLAMIGAFLGWQAVPFTIFAGSIVGSVIGIGAMIVQRGSLQLRIPFGPFLAFGALAWIYLGPELPESFRMLAPLR